MAENILFDIQVEIMKRLPVKSLLQFRSVSKSWKYLIDSSDFIKYYSGQQQHLLVRYDDSVDCEQKYVSIVDDDTFPEQKVSMTIPLLVKMLKNSRTIGSSHGLLCLYGDCQEDRDGLVSGTVVIWNPSIRKAVVVVVPNVGYVMYAAVLGFGVCRETTDPKIVKITHIHRCSDSNTVARQVEVFTLSTGAWRSPYRNRPRKSIRFDLCSVVVDGVLYWRATDRINKDGVLRSYNLIISFDMTSEEFRDVNLPNSLAHLDDYKLSMSKLNESLVVLERDVEARKEVIRVWTMEHGVPKSFTKLFTIDANTLSASVMGFRKSGEPILEILEVRFGDYKVVAYEPYSEEINNLGITNVTCAYYAYRYMETLLLLDQPDFIICDKGKRCFENFKVER